MEDYSEIIQRLDRIQSDLDDLKSKGISQGLWVSLVADLIAERIKRC